jgi:hypothetical protein
VKRSAASALTPVRGERLAQFLTSALRALIERLQLDAGETALAHHGDVARLQLDSLPIGHDIKLGVDDLAARMLSEHHAPAGRRVLRRGRRDRTRRCGQHHDGDKAADYRIN